MDRNQFLVSLYNEVSTLSDCRTLQFNISSDKNREELIINMPSYADKPSEKLKKAKYNDILVQIDFACIKKIELESK